MGPKKDQRAVRGSSLDRLSATLELNKSVETLKEVSTTRVQALRARGIVSVRDLLETYPRRYLDMSEVKSIAAASMGDTCSIVARVYDIKKKTPRPRLNLIELTVNDGTETMIVTCFNQPWLFKQISEGMTLMFSGKLEFNYGFKRMTNPVLEVMDDASEAQGLILPFHPASAKVSQSLMRRLVGYALDKIQGLYDPIPLLLRTKYRLCTRYHAYRAIHKPQSMDEVSSARRRLIYEELFFLELTLLSEYKNRSQHESAYCHTIQGESLTALRGLLPFSLTKDQNLAIEAILSDMSAPSFMQHLLLGDVGTGKTVVALFALVAACQSGNQAVMIAPTEVLVRQYEQSLLPFIEALGYSCALLSGSTTPSEKAEIVTKLYKGEISVLFGTHALLEDDVIFKQCSLVCIDEQQRFGVNQREKLLSKAPGADILSLTATPIPRSLALALYGDMNISYLKEAPAHQKGRRTHVCHFSEEGIAYDAIREALMRGEQAYVICPLIGVDLSQTDTSVEEESSEEERIEYASVEWRLETDSFSDSKREALTHAKILQEQVFPEANVALLHGRMTSAEKHDIMTRFYAGEIDVLVSTTVVEVGVDVPNATVMIIEDADRFGLAQLHQLRGRVGRGDKPGEVFLISRSKAPHALERLAAMTQTEDGFKLSEIDLSQRREGDIFGLRQHGKSSLKLVNVVRDAAIIEAARNDAYDVLYNNILSEEEYKIVMRELEYFRGDNS